MKKSKTVIMRKYENQVNTSLQYKFDGIRQILYILVHIFQIPTHAVESGALRIAVSVFWYNGEIHERVVS